MAPNENLPQSEVDFSTSYDFHPLAWLVRPCEWYKQEYQDCTSFRGRVHQLFISGQHDSCDGWRDDFYNCSAFRKSQNPDLLKPIIESELARKQKRFANERANNVWEYRTEPPADWKGSPNEGTTTN